MRYPGYYWARHPSFFTLIPVLSFIKIPTSGHVSKNRSLHQHHCEDFKSHSFLNLSSITKLNFGFRLHYFRTNSLRMAHTNCNTELSPSLSLSLSLSKYIYIYIYIYIIVARWRNYFSQLFNVHRVKDFGLVEILTAEPLVPEPSAFEVELVIDKLKKS